MLLELTDQQIRTNKGKETNTIRDWILNTTNSLQDSYQIIINRKIAIK